MTILNVLTLLSYIALNVDILFQIRKIYATKSCRDISLVGMAVRYGAILIILVKFISLSDVPLIIGQVMVMLSFSAYLFLASCYFKNSRSDDVEAL